MSDNLVACASAGRIVDVPATIGQSVQAGDPLLVVEATGARIVVDAPVAGRVKRLFFAIDEMLPEAAVVAVIET